MVSFSYSEIHRMEASSPEGGGDPLAPAPVEGRGSQTGRDGEPSPEALSNVNDEPDHMMPLIISNVRHVDEDVHMFADEDRDDPASQNESNLRVIKTEEIHVVPSAEGVSSNSRPNGGTNVDAANMLGVQTETTPILQEREIQVVKEEDEKDPLELSPVHETEDSDGDMCVDLNSMLDDASLTSEQLDRVISGSDRRHRYDDYGNKIVGMKCDVCGKRFNSNKEMEAHRSTHPQIRCSDGCSLSFATPDRLKEHRSTCLKKRPANAQKMKELIAVKCDVCGISFRSAKNIQEFEKHRSRCLKKNLEKSLLKTKLRTVNCDVCGKGFQTGKEEFKEHRSRCLKNRLENSLKKNTVNCDICGKGFQDDKDMQAHKKATHELHKSRRKKQDLSVVRQQTPEEQDPDEFACQHCPFSASVQSKLLQHLQDTHLGLMFGGGKRLKVTCRKLSESAVLEESRNDSKSSPETEAKRTGDETKLVRDTAYEKISSDTVRKPLFKCDLCDYRSFTSKGIGVHKRNSQSCGAAVRLAVQKMTEAASAIAATGPPQKADSENGQHCKGPEVMVVARYMCRLCDFSSALALEVKGHMTDKHYLNTQPIEMVDKMINHQVPLEARADKRVPDVLQQNAPKRPKFKAAQSKKKDNSNKENENPSSTNSAGQLAPSTAVKCLPFHCKLCSFSSRRILSVKAHIRSAHSKELKSMSKDDVETPEDSVQKAKQQVVQLQSESSDAAAPFSATSVITSSSNSGRKRSLVDASHSGLQLQKSYKKQRRSSSSNAAPFNSTPETTSPNTEDEEKQSSSVTSNSCSEQLQYEKLVPMLNGSKIGNWHRRIPAQMDDLIGNGQDMLRCKICKFSSGKLGPMRFHMQKNHKVDGQILIHLAEKTRKTLKEVDDFVHRCRMCDFRARRHGSVRCHVGTAHPEAENDDRQVILVEETPWPQE